MPLDGQAPAGGHPKQDTPKQDTSDLGNPVSCVSALASIEIMERDDLAGAARRIGAAVTEVLTGLQTDHPAIGDIRGRGAMVAMELVRPGTMEPDAEAAKRIVAACHRAGVVTLSCGSYGNVIRLLPPLVIDDGLLADGLDVLADAVATELG